MGRFKTLAGAETVREQDGMLNGQPVTVRLWRREQGSTAGVLFVSVLHGEGEGTTEQFSGERRKLAYRAYLDTTEQLAPFDLEAPVEAPASPAAEPAPAELTPAQKAARTRKLRQQGQAPAPAPAAPLSAEERAAIRKEAARKAVETRRARQAAQTA